MIDVEKEFGYRVDEYYELYSVSLEEGGPCVSVPEEIQFSLYDL
jgi:hypothetical protein